MGFLDSIKRGLRLIKLDGKAAAEIAKDSNSTLYGWLFIIIAGLVNVLASLILFIFSPYELLYGLAYYVGLGLLWILILHGLAKLFGGKSKLKEYFRAQSHVSLLSWLSILTMVNIKFLPDIIGLMISIWSIVMTIVVVKAVHEISTWKAIIVALALPLILIILVLIGGLAYFGVLNPDQFLPSV
ncbi:YIP1 family protein [Candidatus Woesearchaeota archaeon]|nr:YIP1 family protein [Candidatus Woesearchaeota archaeon]